MDLNKGYLKGDKAYRGRQMKCIKMKAEGIDICVTIKVKPIFMKKAGGELEEAVERLETERVLKYLGAKQEAAVAQVIVEEYQHRKELE